MDSLEQLTECIEKLHNRAFEECQERNFNFLGNFVSAYYEYTYTANLLRKLNMKDKIKPLSVEIVDKFTRIKFTQD